MTWKRVGWFVGIVVALVVGGALVSTVLPIFTPIVFFGKVVDEKGNPVSDAKVRVDFVDTFWDGKDHTRRNEITDVQGRFSTFGHGMAIIIENVKKDGYYDLNKSEQFQTKNHHGVFGYTKGGGDFDPHLNPNNPAILVLKRMGLTEPLISVGERCIRVQKDGTPIGVSLATGKAVPSGQGDIEVECWTNDQGHQPNSNLPYDWHCQISVPGGGLVARAGEFDFMAPPDGYAASDEINMPASMGTSWRDHAKRQYFLHLASDRYARIEFEMIAGGDHFFVMASYLNPKPGSRNLEYDPANKATASAP